MRIGYCRRGSAWRPASITTVAMTFVAGEAGRGQLRFQLLAQLGQGLAEMLAGASICRCRALRASVGGSGIACARGRRGRWLADGHAGRRRSTRRCRRAARRGRSMRWISSGSVMRYPPWIEVLELAAQLFCGGCRAGCHRRNAGRGEVGGDRGMAMRFLGNGSGPLQLIDPRRLQSCQNSYAEYRHSLDLRPQCAGPDARCNWSREKRVMRASRGVPAASRRTSTWARCRRAFHWMTVTGRRLRMLLCSRTVQAEADVPRLYLAAAAPCPRPCGVWVTRMCQGAVGQLQGQQLVVVVIVR